MSRAYVEMSAQECRDAIAPGGVGRIAFCGPDVPRIYPVNFAVVDGDVVLRVSPYTDLGMQLDGKPVAFEADELDHDRRSGWSVVVQGDASTVEDPDESVRLRRLVQEPWAPGQRSLFVRIRPHGMTGRRVTGGF